MVGSYVVEKEDIQVEMEVTIAEEQEVHNHMLQQMKNTHFHLAKNALK